MSAVPSTIGGCTDSQSEGTAEFRAATPAATDSTADVQQQSGQPNAATAALSGDPPIHAAAAQIVLVQQQL